MSSRHAYVSSQLSNFPRLGQSLGNVESVRRYEDRNLQKACLRHIPVPRLVDQAVAAMREAADENAAEERARARKGVQGEPLVTLE